MTRPRLRAVALAWLVLTAPIVPTIALGGPASPAGTAVADGGNWTSNSSMPVSESTGGAAAVGGDVYVVGGYASGGVEIDDVQRYDTATDSWTTVAPLPEGRFHLGAAGLNGKVYAVGGRTDPADKQRQSDSSQTSVLASFSILRALGAWVGAIAGTVLMVLSLPLVLGGGTGALGIQEMIFFDAINGTFLLPAAALGRAGVSKIAGAV